MRCRESGIGLLERDFIIENFRGHVVTPGANQGRQSDKDFLMFGSRDDSPASTLPLFVEGRGRSATGFLGCAQSILLAATGILPLNVNIRAEHNNRAQQK